jgi:hypothetical protein
MNKSRRPVRDAQTIEEVFPTFVEELEILTAQANRPDLIEQIRQLAIVDRCSCGQGNCAHFYTAPKPAGSHGAGHVSLLLPAKRGLIAYDLVDGKIAAIEVLDRPDVKAALDRYLAPARRRR